MSEIIRERLREAMKNSGRRAGELAESLGFHRQHISDFLRHKKAALSLEVLKDIARETGVSWVWLSGESAGAAAPLPAREAQAPDLPVYGVAAGSAIGAMAISDHPVEWVQRPAGIASARDAYALFVTGGSMEPRYRPGEIIFVNPHRPVRAGDIVILQVRGHDGAAVESWIKEFVKRDPATGDWITRQYSPPAEMRFAAKTVAEVHRVMTTNELFGV